MFFIGTILFVVSRYVIRVQQSPPDVRRLTTVSSKESTSIPDRISRFFTQFKPELPAIVFVLRKEACRQVAERLVEDGLKATSVTGDDNSEY